MLNRQKVVLTMLRESGGAVSSLQLTKWLFLLAQESPSRGGSSFYQFVPYKYGPYSFTLFQEMASLEREGYIAAIDRERWKLTNEGRSYDLQLPANLRQNCREIVRLYGSFDIPSLLNIVYERYPWFAIKAAQRRPRTPLPPIAETAIYTMGYEGLQVDGFLNELLRNGVQRILDVRSNPTSRRYGFHKTTLSRLCNYVGLEYEHYPEVGIPAADRAHLDSPTDYQDLFSNYECDILPTQTKAIERLAQLLTERASVLVCLEADPAMCHRSRLADTLVQNTDLSVVHLGWPR